MHKLKILVLGLIPIMVASLFTVGCGNKGEQLSPQGTGQPAQTIKLNGAGASFPYPLYSKWIERYKSVKPEVAIDYQSIGSGGGIKGISERTLDFAGSDAPMTDEELDKAPGSIIHIPAVLGAVVIAYNLPGKPELNLDGQTISDIFMGKIKKWNDPKLASLNPNVKLPDKEIAVIHRSDGSGTTYVFTDFLSSVSSSWKNGPGKGKSIEWPVGIGAKGNEGVSGQLTQIEGAIGYLELAYDVKNNLPYVRVHNKEGKFIKPTTSSITAAAAGSAASMPDDLRVSIVNAPGADAYPIATYTYLLVYKDQSDQVKGKALAEYLWWATHDGQADAAELLYAPLPDNVVKLVEGKLKSMTFQGHPLL